MSTDQNDTPDPASVAKTIETLARRIRTRSRILTGEGLTRGNAGNPAQAAAWEAEQRAGLDDLRAQLAHWEDIRDQAAAESAPPAATTFEYIVPVDPMDDLQCDSCQ